MATACPILNQTYVECDGCEDEVDVEWYCLSCKSNLCGKCKTARLHRKHTIKAWMDPAAVSARQDAPMPCDIHPDKTYVNYCTDCSVLCCSTCNAGDHCGHRSKTIEDIFDEKLRDMKKFIEELKGDCMPLAVRKKEKLIKGVEKCKSECHLNKQKIKQRIDSLRKDLTDMEDKLMKEEETKTKENVEKLQKELLLVEQTEKNITKTVTDMEKEISISNRQSIILKSLSFPTLGKYKVSEIDDIPDREFKKSDFKFPSAEGTVGWSAESGEFMMKPAYIPMKGPVIKYERISAKKYESIPANVQTRISAKTYENIPVYTYESIPAYVPTKAKPRNHEGRKELKKADEKFQLFTHMQFMIEFQSVNQKRQR